MQTSNEGYSYIKRERRTQAQKIFGSEIEKITQAFASSIETKVGTRGFLFHQARQSTVLTVVFIRIIVPHFLPGDLLLHLKMELFRFHIGISFNI